MPHARHMHMRAISAHHLRTVCMPTTCLAPDPDGPMSQAACAVDQVTLMTKTIAYIVMPIIFMSLVSIGFGVVHVVTRINAWRDRRKARRNSRAEPPEHHYTAKMTAKLNVCIHAFMYFLNLSYMMLARRVLAIFDCKYLCQLPVYDDRGYISSCKEGHYYLEVDPRMHCYEYDLSPTADEFTKQWTRMALISLIGVVLYLIGIPGLFFYKLFSNRAYTIFTKSLSMLSEQVGSKYLSRRHACTRLQPIARRVTAFRAPGCTPLLVRYSRGRSAVRPYTVARLLCVHVCSASTLSPAGRVGRPPPREGSAANARAGQPVRAHARPAAAEAAPRTAAQGERLPQEAHGHAHQPATAGAQAVPDHQPVGERTQVRRAAPRATHMHP